MNCKITVVIAVATFFSCLDGGGNGVTSKTATNSSTVVESFTFDRTSLSDTLDLGTLRVGKTATREVRFVNNDTIPMVVMNMGMSCNCMAVAYERRPVKPGEAAVITLIYDPKGQSGSQFKNISVRLSSSPEPYTLYVACKIAE